MTTTSLSENVVHRGGVLIARRCLIRKRILNVEHILVAIIFEWILSKVVGHLLSTQQQYAGEQNNKIREVIDKCEDHRANNKLISVSG